MLFNEPKLLKCMQPKRQIRYAQVSVLFNEPKLLKSAALRIEHQIVICFSALQRAEIAEIRGSTMPKAARDEVSVLFNEPKLLKLFGM